MSNIKLALRGLLRTPGFTAIAIASIALGIGANTAIFTLVDQVLLRALPVRAPEQLVQVTLDGNHYGNNWGDLSEISYPWYTSLASQPVFDGVFGRFGYKINVGSAGRTEEARGEVVTGTGLLPRTEAGFKSPGRHWIGFDSFANRTPLAQSG